ncbi:MAG: alpha/beta fold hydrolase [Deltaproteobacteria bacterium]|nr:alpha/beta fold hydrolase [Deltaproteobacteria bacterium]MBW2414928.1 alpha/beta fold hydrolase [Deltaproteobacteria bacterium]
MPVANVNGQHIYYEDSGGDGPAVIFSHGFLMDHTMFDPQVEALAPEFRCIRWDERGFGRTEAKGPFTYWDSADDCIGLLDHLGVEQAVLAGMSQGGFLSLRAALSHASRVRGLVLIDTQAGVDSAEALAGYRGMIDHWVGDAALEPVAQVVAGLILGTPELEGEWMAVWNQRDRKSLAYPGACLLERDDIVPRLGEIRCPALVVHGSEDQAIELALGQALADGLADCRGLVVVPGAAHAPNLSHPDKVNGPVLDFLRGLSAD